MKLPGGVRLSPATGDALRSALGEAGLAGESLLADIMGRERSVSAGQAEAVIGRAVLADLVTLGLVRLADGSYVPQARLDLVGQLLVASDLRRHRRAPDFVVGPGPASFLLARHVRPHRAGALLDLGSGSGIQGLLLGDDRTEVVGVDINPRAVAFTAFNASLNGRRRAHCRLGDFLTGEPDRHLEGRFQTVVANPPFVLAPTPELLYRDRPLGGDEVGRRTVEAVARALAPGGRGYVLCNWVDGEPAALGGPDDWARPVRGWLAGLPVAAVASRAAAVDPATYAAIWTRDLPSARRAAAGGAWTAALMAEGVRRIHVGVIALARSAAGARPGLLAAIEQPREAHWQVVEDLLDGPARPMGGHGALAGPPARHGDPRLAREPETRSTRREGDAAA